jgi:DNA invertase Pin-like site-specific DNA recombinase
MRVPGVPVGQGVHKVTFEQVERMRKLHEQGLKAKEISKTFNVSLGYVIRILNKEARVFS